MGSPEHHGVWGDPAAPAPAGPLHVGQGLVPVITGDLESAARSAHVGPGEGRQLAHFANGFPSPTAFTWKGSSWGSRLGCLSPEQARSGITCTSQDGQTQVSQCLREQEEKINQKPL